MTSQLSLITYSGNKTRVQSLRQADFIWTSYYEISDSRSNTNFSNKTTKRNLDHESTLRFHNSHEVSRKIHFVRFESEILHNNLVLIDSQLPLVIGELILLFHETQICSLLELTKKLAIKNPLGIDNQITNLYYENVIKRMLFALAKGMRADKIWHGGNDSVKFLLQTTNQDSVFCSGLYNSKKIEDYFFRNTVIIPLLPDKYHDENIVWRENKVLFKRDLHFRLR
jgi:hypothetical protein